MSTTGPLNLQDPNPLAAIIEALNGMREELIRIEEAIRDTAARGAVECE